jgi:nicotinate-nucleotide adenylyltransferase
VSLSGPADLFFGGSFDPIHQGHILIARAVHDQTSRKTVLLVPNRANPLKTSGPQASARHRIEMIREAIRGIEWCSVSAVEIDSDRPSYTIDTIRRLIAGNVLVPKPGMIIGDDLAAQITRWHQWEQLLKIVTIVLVRRLEEGDSLPPNLPEDTQIVRNEKIPISSTEIRNRLREGRSIKGLVPTGVHEYIQRYNPYN